MAKKVSKGKNNLVTSNNRNSSTSKIVNSVYQVSRSDSLNWPNGVSTETSTVMNCHYSEKGVVSIRKKLKDIRKCPFIRVHYATLYTVPYHIGF